MPERYAPGPGYMDWANQPDPFRRFSGAGNIELPLVLDDGTWQSLYHFTMGGAVEDDRLQMLPASKHLGPRSYRRRRSRERG
jgi:hypothetical protein